ncbi:hypothetical protein QTJ16_002984 [Diplocarpon rosae]|uniref:Uncharacterized protein n=1 Tax=Diplocarpon rosae TaxID=946125 RepID=A0AAD9WFK1_9HELO|nr:hypothetical protein QTJ16_002984 [Diplocarpon rosae]
MLYSLTTLVCAALVPIVLGRSVVFNNRCDVPVLFKRVWHMGEDPYDTIVQSGQSMELPLRQEMDQVYKLQKGAGMSSGILQFEISVRDDGVTTWNPSHNDGNTNGVPGTSVFGNDNVSFTPVGNANPERYNTCKTVMCRAGEICQGSYQNPHDDEKMQTCSPETYKFIIEFCASL